MNDQFKLKTELNLLVKNVEIHSSLEPYPNVFDITARP